MKSVTLIKKEALRLAQDPYVLWGSFAAGFLIPYCFILFAALGLVAAWQGLKSEYGDVAAAWHDRLFAKPVAKKSETPKPAIALTEPAILLEEAA